MLTRLGGQPMAVNPDLIEKAEATPDTVITLVDGHKFVVAEPVAVVVERVRAWRASVAAEAFAMAEPAASEQVPDRMPGQRQGADRNASLREAVRDGGELAADGSGGSSLARVLQLPAREE